MSGISIYNGDGDKTLRFTTPSPM